MSAWLPVPGTTSGRLVEAALALFGARGYDAVSVVEIAAAAGVTTGALYHHFENKAGLYILVRADVEQRVLDRIEGAAAVTTIRTPADAAPALLVGYDYLVRTGFARLIGETPPFDVDASDAVVTAVDRLLGGRTPLGALVVSAWRTALWHAADDPAAARAALEALLTTR
jgi:AcrR family transcriptional regulator